MKMIGALLGLFVVGLTQASHAGLSLEDLRARLAAVDSKRFPSRSVASTDDGATGGIGGGSSQAAADRQALESCEAYSHGRTCRVEGSRETGGVDFARGKFTAEETPFVWSDSRERLEVFAASAAPFKALALSGSGSWAWRAGSSSADARVQALEACRAVNTRDEELVPCFVYAEGSAVVMTPADLYR